MIDPYQKIDNPRGRARDVLRQPLFVVAELDDDCDWLIHEDSYSADRDYLINVWRQQAIARNECSRRTRVMRVDDETLKPSVHDWVEMKIPDNWGWQPVSEKTGLLTSPDGHTRREPVDGVEAIRIAYQKGPGIATRGGWSDG